MVFRQKLNSAFIFGSSNLFFLPLILLFFFALLLSPDLSFAKSENRVLREIRGLKENVKNLREDVGELREDVDKLKGEMEVLKEEVGQIKEEVGKLKEEIGEIKGELKQMNKRFDDLLKRIDSLERIMLAMFAGLIALVVAVIGFAWWDRRTIIRRSVEEAKAQIEVYGKLKDVIGVLRELSKDDEKLADIMKKFGLM